LRLSLENNSWSNLPDLGQRANSMAFCWVKNSTVPSLGCGSRPSCAWLEFGSALCSFARHSAGAVLQARRRTVLDHAALAAGRIEADFVHERSDQDQPSAADPTQVVRIHGTIEQGCVETTTIVAHDETGRS